MKFESVFLLLAITAFVTEGFLTKDSPEIQCIQDNLDYYGGDLRDFDAESFEECHDACINEPQCRYWTWTTEGFSRKFIQPFYKIESLISVPLFRMVEQKVQFEEESRGKALQSQDRFRTKTLYVPRTC